MLWISLPDSTAGFRCWPLTCADLTSSKCLLPDQPSSIWGTFIGLLEYYPSAKSNRAAHLGAKEITHVSRWCHRLNSSRLYLKASILRGVEWEWDGFAGKLSEATWSTRAMRENSAKRVLIVGGAEGVGKEWQNERAGQTSMEGHSCAVTWGWSQDTWQVSQWSDRERRTIKSPFWASFVRRCSEPGLGRQWGRGFYAHEKGQF